VKMELKMLEHSFKTEDGYIFSCEDYAKVIIAVRTSNSSAEVFEKLKKKRVEFDMYKIESEVRK